MAEDRQAELPATHHYIPIFYSKRWASGEPSRLIRYARWKEDVVSVDRKAPKGVGWEKNGYSYDGLQGSDAEDIELNLMKPGDDRASKMLARLEASGVDGHWADIDRYAWTWFILSLFMRGPEDIRAAKRDIAQEFVEPHPRFEARYRQLLQEFPGVDHQETLRDYLISLGPDHGHRLGLKLAADLTDHDEISTSVANMYWGVRQIRGSKLLVTSDRPVRREYPLRSKSSIITLPLGPRLLFLASTSAEGLDRQLRKAEDDLVRLNNRIVVRQARRFAFAFDYSDSEWIKRNLAREAEPAFFDLIRLAEERGRRAAKRHRR